MTDHELLEAAAKAAGLDLTLTGCVWDNETAEMELWNPLVSDADALRLAVKLQMNVHRYGERVTVDGAVYIAATGEDGYAATRRAIVRAAAALEKQ
jgi:hypothetical protein